MIGCYGSAGEAVRGAMQHSGTCYRFFVVRHWVQAPMRGLWNTTHSPVS